MCVLANTARWRRAPSVFVYFFTTRTRERTVAFPIMFDRKGRRTNGHVIKK